MEDSLDRAYLYFIVFHDYSFIISV